MRYKVKATFDRKNLDNGKPEKGLVREYELNAGDDEGAREEAMRLLRKDESTIDMITSLELSNLGADKK